MARKTAKPGRSTRKQSHWPWLGRYVVRRDLRRTGEHAGTHEIAFAVPKRLRPSGWPATVQLPRDKPYCAGPDDLAAIIRIRADADALYAALRETKGTAPPEAPATRAGSIPWLIVQWGGARLLAAVEGNLDTMAVALEPGAAGAEGGRDDWREMSAHWRANTIRTLRHVWAWSATNRHKHARGIGPKECKAFLDLYSGKPGQRKNIRGALNKLLSIAIEEAELERSPLAAIRATRQKRTRRAVTIWTREIVGLYAETALTQFFRPGKGATAERIAWPGGAALVRLMWETSADSTDVAAWTKRENFRDDARRPAIVFDRGKTGVAADIPISKALAALIRGNGSLYVVTDPASLPYGGFAGFSRLRSNMRSLRRAAVAAGAPLMVFDHLRHSAATDAEERGATPDDVRHLTQHKNAKTTRAHYLQISSKKADEIQRARGIIE